MKPLYSYCLTALLAVVTLHTSIGGDEEQITKQFHQAMKSANADYQETNVKLMQVRNGHISFVRMFNTDLSSLSFLKQFKTKRLCLDKCSSDDWNSLGISNLGLQSLDLYYCEGIKSLDFVKRCSPIDYISIRGDYPSLEDLQGSEIGHLRVWSASLKELEPIQGIKGLQELSLTSCTAIADYSPLQKLSITSFSISGLTSFKNSDVKYLSGLKLQSLSFTNQVPIKSLEFLREHPALTSLAISEDIKDFRPIACLTKLRCLRIGSKWYTGDALKTWLNEHVTNCRSTSPSVADEAAKRAAQEQEIADQKAIRSELNIDFDDCKNALAMIECRNGAVGSGFIVRDFNDEFYLYTNQHVIQGTSKFSARTIKNRKLKPVSFQVSDTRDVVRFKLDPEQKYENFLQFAESTSNGDPVVVYGNSGGGGVFTSIYGRVAGVGPDRIEVTAKFVPGNSGSPILDAKGKVVGIATYMTRQNANADWTVEGTRFGEIRRFAFRVDPNMKWVSMRWKDYQKYATMIEEDREFAKDIFKLAVTWLKTPYDHIPEDNFERSELRRWIKTHNSLAEKIQKVISASSLKQSKRDSINRTAKSYTKKNTDELEAICTRKARYIRMKVKGGKSRLTEFLKEDILLNAKILEAMAKDIDKYGTQLSNQDAVVYRRR